MFAKLSAVHRSGRFGRPERGDTRSAAAQGDATAGDLDHWPKRRAPAPFPGRGV